MSYQHFKQNRQESITGWSLCTCSTMIFYKLLKQSNSSKWLAKRFLDIFIWLHHWTQIIKHCDSISGERTVRKPTFCIFCKPLNDEHVIMAVLGAMLKAVESGPTTTESMGWGEKLPSSPNQSFVSRWGGLFVSWSFQTQVCFFGC